MSVQPIPVQPDPAMVMPIGQPPEFQVSLDVFEGPLPLLLHVIESRELDILSVPLAAVADAYVAYLARHPVEPAHLAQFVAVAAQLILIKSRSLLPDESALSPGPGATDEGEEELRRRLLEYRAVRDAARDLAGRDMAAPLLRREPRETDLPMAPITLVAPILLKEALEQLATIAEPEPEPTAVLGREITLAQQIAVLREALGSGQKVVLQTVLAASRSRTELVVTLLAALELVRRREVRARQRTMFGPIVLEPVPETDP